MDQELWQRITIIVDEVSQQDREFWPTLILEQCGDNVELFLQVASLLAVEDDERFENPVFGRPC